MLRLAGCVIVALAVSAFVAPPFSGLDTLPSLGAVLIALAIVLEDVLVLAAGAVIGAVGIALIITIGASALQIAKHLW